MVYQKIDINLAPQLVIGTLDRRSICACGRLNVPADVREGTQFQCDLKSVRWVKFQCHGCGKEHKTRVIDVWDPVTWVPHWFLLELLDLDAAILAALPDAGVRWEKVKNNEVAPAARRPRGRIF